MSSEVKTLIRKAITVQDLRDCLENCPDDAAVIFHCDYGDACHTQQAFAVESVVLHDTDHLVSTPYSHSRVAYEHPDDRTTDSKPVVFLS